MAVLYVAEFAHLAYDPSGLGSAAQIPPLQEQTVVIGAGSLKPASAFTAATAYVRIHTDVVCSITFGPAATAVAAATRMRLAANQTEYFSVPRGAGWTVAVITNS